MRALALIGAYAVNAASIVFCFATATSVRDWSWAARIGVFGAWAVAVILVTAVVIAYLERNPRNARAREA